MGKVKESRLAGSGGGGGPEAVLQIDSSKVLAAMDRLMQAEETGDEGMTTMEMAKRYGVSKETMRTRILKQMEQGSIVQGVGIRVNTAGVRTPVPVYRPADPRLGLRS